jgi:hypothetical protein
MVRVYSSRNAFAFWIIPSSFFLRREFHSQPVEQRALGLRLPGGDFDQAPNQLGSAIRSGQPMP